MKTSPTPCPQWWSATKKHGKSTWDGPAILSGKTVDTFQKAELKRCIGYLDQQVAAMKKESANAPEVVKRVVANHIQIIEAQSSHLREKLDIIERGGKL